MSKPHATKGIKPKRAATAFKSEWLDEVAETETLDSRNAKPMRVQLSEIFTYCEENGVVSCYVEMQKQIAQTEKFGMMSGNWTF